MAAFIPRTPLETTIHSGDVEATLALLRATAPEQRSDERASLQRMAKVVETARYGDRKGDWGGAATDAQQRSLYIAILLCGTAKDVAASWISDEDLIMLGSEFRPRSLEGLAEAMLDRSPQRIRTVSKLIAAGLVPRPDSDAYSLGLIALPTLFHKPDDLAALFAADPGLRPTLLRVFNIEGTADVSLASCDKYCSQRWASWDVLLPALVDDGISSREQLLDLTLGALERDWPQHRSGWFSRFHATLVPTDAELQRNGARYLALCGSRIAPTVTMALDALRRIDAADPLPGAALLDALRPALASSVRSQLEAALKLLDRLVAREPHAAARASEVAAFALLHDTAAIQALVLGRLARWGISDDLRARLPDFAAGLAATNRPALAALAGPDLAPDAVPAVAPTVPLERKRVPPTAEARRIAPITDPQELVDCIAHVFEHPEDVEEFERAMAGLVTAAPVADAKPLFAPVLKRAAKVRHLLPRELARLLLLVAAGQCIAGSAGTDPGGNPGPVDELLIARVNELMQWALAGHRLVPLATPTHQGGFIDPLQLLSRWQAHAAASAMPPVAEQVRALSRLATEASPDALARARSLPDHPFTRAVRYALGDAMNPGEDRALFAAAARIRHPGGDDLALDASHPGLGPDAALAARYTWRTEAQTWTYNEQTYTHHHFRLESTPAHIDPPEHLPAVERHQPAQAVRRHSRCWTFGGFDAGAIRYAATLLPSDLQAFFADGAKAFGNNLDWSEAQWHNRAYLEPLLEPTTAMTPMARLLLVLALAGKEPGQTAVAVDALVRAHGDGRLDDHQAMAETVRELVASPLLKLARLHKSLQAALRADPGLGDLVFTLLQAALQARPEDPPRDIPLVLGFLVELQVEGSRTLASATCAALKAMKLSGNAQALRKRLIPSG